MDAVKLDHPENKHADLTGSDAIRKIAEQVRITETCFFCTCDRNGGIAGARPMSVQQVDDEGNLWFLSADDSNKNQEIGANPLVRLYFQGSSHSDFLTLEGVATVVRDRARARDLWRFAMGSWFDEGENDPRITLIKVAPTQGYYWDNKHGNAVAGVKMLIGVAIGKAMDDAIEGKLSISREPFAAL